jgi:hypothetical protein
MNIRENYLQAAEMKVQNGFRAVFLFQFLNWFRLRFLLWLFLLFLKDLCEALEEAGIGPHFKFMFYEGSPRQ